MWDSRPPTTPRPLQYLPPLDPKSLYQIRPHHPLEPLISHNIPTQSFAILQSILVQYLSYLIDYAQFFGLRLTSDSCSTDVPKYWYPHELSPAPYSRSPVPYLSYFSAQFGHIHYSPFTWCGVPPNSYGRKFLINTWIKCG